MLGQFWFLYNSLCQRERDGNRSTFQNAVFLDPLDDGQSPKT
jgi:hypothetical protein